eukprot:scaffold11858_cov29-Phaeocystis_antarctica.AAC.1
MLLAVGMEEPAADLAPLPVLETALRLMQSTASMSRVLPLYILSRAPPSARALALALTPTIAPTLNINLTLAPNPNPNPNPNPAPNPNQARADQVSVPAFGLRGAQLLGLARTARLESPH